MEIKRRKRLGRIHYTAKKEGVDLPAFGAEAADPQVAFTVAAAKADPQKRKMKMEQLTAMRWQK
jgi:hypothetical protein